MIRRSIVYKPFAVLKVQDVCDFRDDRDKLTISLLIRRCPVATTLVAWTLQVIEEINLDMALLASKIENYVTVGWKSLKGVLIHYFIHLHP